MVNLKQIQDSLEEGFTLQALSLVKPTNLTSIKDELWNLFGFAPSDLSKNLDYLCSSFIIGNGIKKTYITIFVTTKNKETVDSSIKESEDRSVVLEFIEKNISAFDFHEKEILSLIDNGLKSEGVIKTFLEWESQILYNRNYKAYKIT